jgi:hypothetical protein
MRESYERRVDSQIITILKKAEAGMKTADVCREEGSARPRFTSGRHNMVDWKSMKLAG